MVDHTMVNEAGGWLSKVIFKNNKTPREQQKIDHKKH